jgi:uncharacterized metal-binding protein
LPLGAYLVITALGIDKNKDMNLKGEDIDRGKEALPRLQADSGAQFILSAAKALVFPAG